MRVADFFTGALCALTLTTSSILHADAAFRCATSHPPKSSPTAAAKPLTAHLSYIPARGPVRVLVIFAHFQDEETRSVPEFAGRLFDPDLPGSFAHFYDTMSFGQLQVQGTVLSRRYTSDRPAQAYLAAQPDEYGQYDAFVLEILAKIDADLDLRSFDNDGPDSIPDSGDDDGQVDYLFVIMRSTPRNFLLGGATGIAGLISRATYASDDTAASGQPIGVSGSRFRITILQEGSFAQTVGSMAHEFGHALGLPDLYDLEYTNPQEESAGIGKWGLMGWGAHGWRGDDGPAPFCAWSLEKLGWISQDDGRLVEVLDDTGLLVPPLFAEGFVCRIPLRTEFTHPDVIFGQEYLLLEQRTRADHHYNRHLPAEGLLVWHVRSRRTHNGREESKRVDLVCADGLFRDAGFPQGRQTDPRTGFDNLDFWSHDPGYRTAHAGNKGDATDPFDGERFTRLDRATNPSTNAGDFLPPACTGLALRHMTRQGSAMRVDIAQPRWAGTIAAAVHWLGEVIVDGDLTIAPEGQLKVYSHTRVRFTAADRLRGGVDPDRCELHVQGELQIHNKTLTQAVGLTLLPVLAGKVEFRALDPGTTWQGIYLEENGQLQRPEAGWELRDAEHADPISRPLLAAHLPTAVTESQAQTPAAFQLLPNFPNPFNPQTTLRYALTEGARVRLTVRNTLGQLVRQLVDEFQPTGARQAVWNGRDESGQLVASGVYLAALEADGSLVAVRRMLLAR